MIFSSTKPQLLIPKILNCLNIGRVSIKALRDISVRFMLLPKWISVKFEHHCRFDKMFIRPMSVIYVLAIWKTWRNAEFSFKFSEIEEASISSSSKWLKSMIFLFFSNSCFLFYLIIFGYFYKFYHVSYCFFPERNIFFVFL